MINYTFIIPHRNIPLLLERCLWSIPQRNYIQLIVIDDKSDTNLCELQNIITKTQYRVDYIRSSNNLGGGNARNLGLEKAKGKWIIFADADDFFNYCITDILDQNKDSLADIIYF